MRWGSLTCGSLAFGCVCARLVWLCCMNHLASSISCWVRCPVGCFAFALVLGCTSVFLPWLSVCVVAVHESFGAGLSAVGDLLGWGACGVCLLSFAPAGVFPAARTCSPYWCRLAPRAWSPELGGFRSDQLTAELCNGIVSAFCA